MPLIDLVAHGSVTTDRSELTVAIEPDDQGSFIVTPKCKIEQAPFIHDDFSGLQSGRSATETTGPQYRFAVPKSDDVS